jgi:hypothetical protein
MNLTATYRFDRQAKPLESCVITAIPPSQPLCIAKRARLESYDFAAAATTILSLARSAS